MFLLLLGARFVPPSYALHLEILLCRDYHMPVAPCSISLVSGIFLFKLASFTPNIKTLQISSSLEFLIITWIRLFAYFCNLLLCCILRALLMLLE